MAKSTQGLFFFPPHLPHQTEKPIVSVKGVSLFYSNGTALEDIHFDVVAGERLAVIGPNGAGKSTLFKIIAGVLPPSEGRVEVYGNEPGKHICIAYVPQRNQVDWSFPVNVADVVMMGRIGKIGFLRRPTRKDWDIVFQALDTVQLQDYAKRQIRQLSGGQQQRVFIARALAQEAELILMDEPFTGLDFPARQAILNILDILKEKHVTVLVALHDLKTASEYFDRILLLNHRLIAIGKPSEVLLPEHLLYAYGGQLSLIPTEKGIWAMEDTCCEEGDHFHA